ncbi:Ig-like domain-containing protein [Vallitalea okinawensis]|uniref:Ig-like domain-containing protein n=1 Tax=Vallitalea okinawensis TaxID=2078660 RepID=UPI000CFBCC67|nr:Ig-like domain-containing protein [Vallitalea okinawensis]
MNRTFSKRLCIMLFISIILIVGSRFESLSEEIGEINFLYATQNNIKHFDIDDRLWIVWDEADNAESYLVRITNLDTQYFEEYYTTYEEKSFAIEDIGGKGSYQINVDAKDDDDHIVATGKVDIILNVQMSNIAPSNNDLVKLVRDEKLEITYSGYSRDDDAYRIKIIDTNTEDIIIDDITNKKSYQIDNLEFQEESTYYKMWVAAYDDDRIVAENIVYFYVTVVEPQSPKDIFIEPSQIVLNTNEKEKLTVNIDPNSVEVEEANIIWASSDESVAKVDRQSGKVTAIGKGTAIITAKTYNGKLATCIITVLNNEPKEISIEPAQVILHINEVENLLLDITPASINEKDIDIVWVSTNKSVATVDLCAGVVTAVGIGTAEIIVETYNGKTDTCTVRVLESALKEPKEILIEPSQIILNIGDVENLLTQITPSLIDEDEAGIVWVSTDKNVATVDQVTGEVTAIGVGTAIIVAETYNGITDTCIVRVLDREP